MHGLPAAPAAQIGCGATPGVSERLRQVSEGSTRGSIAALRARGAAGACSKTGDSAVADATRVPVAPGSGTKLPG